MKYHTIKILIPVKTWEKNKEIDDAINTLNEDLGQIDKNIAVFDSD